MSPDVVMAWLEVAAASIFVLLLAVLSCVIVWGCARAFQEVRVVMARSQAIREVLRAEGDRE